jgi:hypothetical protein
MKEREKRRKDRGKEERTTHGGKEGRKDRMDRKEEVND